MLGRTQKHTSSADHVQGTVYPVSHHQGACYFHPGTHRRLFARPRTLTNHILLDRHWRPSTSARNNQQTTRIPAARSILATATHHPRSHCQTFRHYVSFLEPLTLAALPDVAIATQTIFIAHSSHRNFSIIYRPQHVTPIPPPFPESHHVIPLALHAVLSSLHLRSRMAVFRTLNFSIFGHPRWKCPRNPRPPPILPSLSV